MDIGFNLPTRGPLAQPEIVAAIARRAEALGFDYLGVSDHIVIPRHIESRYPYSETGEFRGGAECLEQLTLLAYVAACTSRIRLLTSVMVLPHRPPVLAAKVLATLDALSGGRLTVGCGMGWMQEEFEAIGAPPFQERGAVGDEYIQVFRELWTQDAPAYAGRYARFGDIAFAPKPVQSPHPPLWIGGESPQALRRAARLGDGWYPIGNNPRHPLETPHQLREALGRLRRYAEEYGRDPETIGLAFSAGWYSERQAQTMPDGSRRSFTGTADQIAADIRAFSELGVRCLMLGFQGPTLEETFQRAEFFAREIRPLL